MFYHILIIVVCFVLLTNSAKYHDNVLNTLSIFPEEFLRQYALEVITLNVSIAPVKLMALDLCASLPITARTMNSMARLEMRDKSIFMIFIQGLTDIEFVVHSMAPRKIPGDFLHQLKSRQRIIFIHLSLHGDENFDSVPGVVSSQEGATDFFLHDSSIFFVTSGNTSGHRLVLWELYHIRNTWVWKQIDDITNVLALSSRRSDFLGVRLKLLLKELNSTSPHSDETWENLGETWLSELALIMNYTTEIIKSEYFITKGPDVTVGGMGAKLLNYEGDIVATTSEIIEYRVRSLAVSQPVVVVKCGLFFRRVKMVSVKNVFAQAFSLDLWVAGAVTWFAIPFAFVLFVCIKRKTQSLGALHENDQNVFRDVVMWSVGLACQQGWQPRPSSISLQFILFSGLFAAMILNVLFSSSIIAIFSKDPNAFKDVSDLIKYGYTFMIQARARSVWASIQATSNIPHGQQINAPVVETPEAIKQLLTTKSALLTVPTYFFASALEGTNVSADELCKLKSDIKLDWALSRAAIYYRKDDSIRTFLNWKQAMWKERGLALRHQTVYFRESAPECTPRVDFNTVDLIDIRWAFYLLLFGVSFAAIFIVFEMCYNFIKNIPNEFSSSKFRKYLVTHRY